MTEDRNPAPRADRATDSKATPHTNSVATAAAEAAASQDWRVMLRKLGPAGPLGVFMLVVPIVSSLLVITFLGSLADWLRAQGDLGLITYASGFLVLTGLALTSFTWMTALGGFTFGALTGFLAVTTATIGGAVLGFVVCTLISSRRVMMLIEAQPKWHAVHTALVGEGFWKTLGIVILLRLPPNSPFAAMNFVMAATRVHIVPFVLGTAIGLAPRIAAYTWLASTWETLDMAQTKNWWTFGISLVLALIVLAIIGRIANRAIARLTATEAAQEPASEAPPAG